MTPIKANPNNTVILYDAGISNTVKKTLFKLIGKGSDIHRYVIQYGDKEYFFADDLDDANRFYDFQVRSEQFGQINNGENQ